MLRKLLSRPILVGIALILQFAWLFVHVVYLSEHFMAVSFFVQVISVVAMLWLINKDEQAEFKLPWVVLILSAPIFGGIIYFLTSSEGAFKSQHDRYCAEEEKACKASNGMNDMAIQDLTHQDALRTGSFRYLESKGFPVYRNTQSKYYALGDEAFPDMMEAFRGAKKFIFLEYFIITPGKMWDDIKSVLIQKAADGVEIRVMYDDMATMMQLPGAYPKELADKGIQCISFNPFIPVCAIGMNHRDHRKIAVIDGEIAFTGGFNLADEYINLTHPYGCSWKDTGVRLRGDAVNELTLFFLTMWNTAQKETEDFAPYLLAHPQKVLKDGLIQPYAHAPFNDRRILSDVYCNLVNGTSDYLYIYTPYLIPDAALMRALESAASRGVDVRMILPGVPDKKVINQMTKSYYAELLKYGVRLYEYTPGFVHAKCLVADDLIASIGTGNFDCRSLYHSFENGCLFYKTEVVETLKNDFLGTMERCEEIKEHRPHMHIFSGIYYAVLRLFAPLM